MNSAHRNARLEIEITKFLILFRCVIPECDAIDPNKQIYEPEWLRFTTPYREESERPMKCQRYDVSASSVYGSQCAPNKFDRNKTVWCHGNWVFEDTEKTIGTEVRIPTSDGHIWISWIILPSFAVQWSTFIFW